MFFLAMLENFKPLFKGTALDGNLVVFSPEFKRWLYIPVQFLKPLETNFDVDFVFFLAILANFDSLLVRRMLLNFKKMYS